MTCYLWFTYNRKNLKKTGWKLFKKFFNRNKNILMRLNKAKILSYRTTTHYKFIYELPRNNYYDYAISLDKKNGNTKYKDNVDL